MRNTTEYGTQDNPLEALARRLYPMIRSYYESEEGQRALAERREQLGAEDAPADGSAA